MLQSTEVQSFSYSNNPDSARGQSPLSIANDEISFLTFIVVPGKNFFSVCMALFNNLLNFFGANAELILWRIVLHCGKISMLQKHQNYVSWFSYWTKGVSEHFDKNAFESYIFMYSCPSWMWTISICWINQFYRFWYMLMLRFSDYL